MAAVYIPNKMKMLHVITKNNIIYVNSLRQ